jgi:hypothetical protein
MNRIALFLGCATLVACGNPFSVEGRAPVCQHLEKQTFEVPPDVRAQVEALPAELRQGVQVSRNFQFDVSTQLPGQWQSLVQSQFALTSITITAVEGSVDLGFVDQAQVTLKPQAGVTLPARTFDYARTEAAPRAVRWRGEALDVGAYLDTGSLNYEVSLLGALPRGEVVVDVDACAEVTAQLNYL